MGRLDGKTRLALPLVVIVALLIGACGGESARRQDQSAAAGDTVAAASAVAAAAETAVAAAESAAASDNVQYDQPLKTGFFLKHTDAGFGIFWPSACGRVKERVSPGATDRARREFLVSCQRDDGSGHQLSVLVLRRATAEAGNAPHPGLVVAIIEDQLHLLGVRTRSQTPLADAGMEGIDVQAVEPVGTGEVWLRGIIADRDVYVIMAWCQDGKLFDDPQIQAFFNSFQLL